MSSAVVLSILIHAALFLLAGMLVVFTVVKKEEQKFEPPKAIDRPKMKLKKPKVKVKKTSKPKPTTRIVTKMNRANMPDIQLPEMSGMGDGLGGMVGGFDMMPDFSEPTMYGASQSIGNDFVGTFYDSKRGRDGKILSGVDTSGWNWRRQIHKFLVRGWDTSVFSRYYRAPRNLYATSLVVPVTRSSLAPLAFGDKDAVGALWMVHYKGQLVCPASHTNGITFCFWGMADESLVVRVDGRIVLGTAWEDSYWKLQPVVIGNLWNTDSADSRKYYMGHNTAMVGDWITLEPGESLDMEILIGDNGGKGGFFLAVEEAGVEYERNRQGAPILPIFRTVELSHEQLDLIYKFFPEGEMLCLTNGPVFCDYDTSAKAVVALDFEVVGPADSADAGVRTWTLADGRTVEGEFINIFSGKIVLKNKKGKTIKIPKEQLSSEDIEYAELASPPDLDINFLKNFRQVDFSGGFYDISGWNRPSEEWGHYGVQIKQTSSGVYAHGLQAEMFVIGKQWRRSKYVLLDRQTIAFNPAKSEQRFFEYRSDRKTVIALDEYYNATFGEKHYGYLVTVADERGKRISLKSSHKWLPGIVDNLEQLSVGNFFDETGMRTYADRPPKNPKY